MPEVRHGAEEAIEGTDGREEWQERRAPRPLINKDSADGQATAEI